MEGLTADGGAYSRGYLNITRFILSVFSSSLH